MGTTLQISQPQVDIILDPHRMEDAYSMTIIGQIHRGLMRYSPQGDVLKDLADHWTESKNHLEYTFQLKEAKFSSGEAITGEHVRQSFARLFFVGSSMGADMDYIAGVKNFRHSKNINDLGITSPNPREVKFTLARPSALFMKHLAAIDCAVLHITNFQTDARFNEAFAYSGPYRLTASEVGKKEVVKWRKDPLDSERPPEKIVFRQSAEKPESLARQGLTDSLDHDVVSPEDQALFMKGGWQTTVTEIVAERFAILNPTVLSAALRKYLFHKVNQEELHRKVDAQQLFPAYGLIPSGLPGELQKEDMLAFKAGEKFTGTAPKGKIRLQFGDSPLTRKIAEQLKSAWEAPGLSVELAPLSQAEALKAMFSSQSQGVILGAKGLDYFDGYSVMTYFRSGYAGNYFHVHNAAIDKVLDSVVVEFDSHKRSAELKDLQKMVMREYTVIPLFFGSQASGLWSNAIKHVPPHPGGMHTMGLETVTMREL